LFESSWKKPYTDRGIRKILEQYSLEAEALDLSSQVETFFIYVAKKTGD